VEFGPFLISSATETKWESLRGLLREQHREETATAGLPRGMGGWDKKDRNKLRLCYTLNKWKNEANTTSQKKEGQITHDK